MSGLDIDKDIIARILATGRPVTFADGQDLIREGDVDEHLFFIEHGTVEVLRGNTALKRVQPGDIVGEFAFLDRRPRTASVRAAGSVQAYALERHDVLRALANDPAALMQWMNAITLRMRSRLENASGNANDDVDVFLSKLTAESKQHRAVRHRYLKALADGTMPDMRWAMADFGRQYFGYSAHFPRYLTTVISRLEQPEHRAGLLENLTEESGIYDEAELKELATFGVEREWIDKIPHPKLFHRFRIALGVADAVIEDDTDEVVCWREMFLGVLANGSAAEAVGALGLGTEGIVSDIYANFVAALARLPDLSPRDTVFFPLHTAVDDHHQATLLNIAKHYARTDQGRRDLAKGMRKALVLRASFWDWMHERAQSPA